MRFIYCLSLILLIGVSRADSDDVVQNVRGSTEGGRAVVLADQAGQLDAFGRLRVASPKTLFDSKLLFDKDSLFWSEKIVAGALDTLIRQTRTWWNYQPGKSQEVLLTAVLSTAATAQCQVGLFNDTEGLFFRVDGGVAYVGRRTNGVDSLYAQSTWNTDRMDGTGTSGVAVDFSKAQIFFIDFEWLGTGRVCYGFYSAGTPIICHALNHANATTFPYLANPNLPIRYQLVKRAGAGTVSMRVICSTVISGGGSEALGMVRSASNNGAAGHLNADKVDTAYCVMAMKLQPSKLAATVRVETVSLIATTAATDGEWFLCVNPTILGSLPFVAEANSAVMIARGATANVVISEGLGRVNGGLMSQSTRHSIMPIPDAWALGTKVDTTQADTLALCFRPASANADILASWTWRELR